jgi:hypothetical protein
VTSKTKKLIVFGLILVACLAITGLTMHLTNVYYAGNPHRGDGMRFRECR